MKNIESHVKDSTFFPTLFANSSMRQLRPFAPTASGCRLCCSSQRRHPAVVAVSASKGFRKKRGDGVGSSEKEEEEEEEEIATIKDDDDARPLPPTPTPTSADPSAVAASSAAFAAAMSLSAAAIRTVGTSFDLAGKLPGAAEGAASAAKAAALLAAPLLGDASSSSFSSSDASSALAAHAAAAVAAAAVVTGARAAVVAASSSSSSKSSSSDDEEGKNSFASEFDASLALVLPNLSSAQVALWLCLFPSVAEEALFRSALLPLVSADWRGAATVALLFGVLHYSPRAGRGTASAVAATGAGFLYGMLYLWTGGDLVATAGAHALANAGSAALWWSREEERGKRSGAERM